MARLESFAREIFTAAGMDADKAATMAELLVLTDALGWRTHGLAMLPLYLAEITKGAMTVRGEPEVVSERGVVALWDGGYLPGQWMGRARDPALFAGRDAFAEQMDHFATRCRANKPIDPARPVRMPGDAAARNLASARQSGITYDDATWSALAACARDHAVELPEERR